MSDVILWSDGQRAELVRRITGLMPELRIVALGGPGKGQIADLGDELGVKVGDDLRKALIDHPAGWLFLGTADGVGSQELKQAGGAGVSVVTLEPLFGHEAEGSGGWTVVPAMRSSPAWLSAAEPIQVLGKARSMRVTSLCPRGAGSLQARLHDAVEMLVHLMGTPLTVDAALTGGPPEPPDDLHALMGDMTAHLRFNGGVAAVVHVSDRSAAWLRELVVLGDEGELVLDDVSYRLSDRAGKMLDHLDAASTRADPAELIARQWRRILEGSAVTKVSNADAVHACCRAALLSCRTGQSESPGTLLRIQGR